MKTKIKTPYFEIGVKNYAFGDDVLNAAKAADAAAKKYDIDVLFIAPYTEIRTVSANTDRLIVLAPYMDILSPGRGMADVLPEAVKAAGAKGVVINHCEKPVSLTQIKKTIDRANELELITFVCADTLIEAQAVAHLHPDIINPEPTELIGTGATSDMHYVQQSILLIKSISEDILVEQAAGISSGEQVYELTMAGAEATGAASGIFCSKNPTAMIDEMVGSVRKAADELSKRRNK